MAMGDAGGNFEFLRTHEPGLATHARASLDRLDAALLARAFRGELVPQEPAATLLARIRAQREAAPTVKRGRTAKATADA